MPNKQKQDPKTSAQELLEKCNIRSFPVPIEKIAKFLGAQIRFSPLDKDLSGMVYIKDGVPIIGVNALHHPNRQRFTIAHEIAHIILHKEELSEEVHVDKQFPILMRDHLASTGTDQREMAANDFAANLLVPQEALEKALKDITTDDIDDEPLDDLAKKFKVSRQMLEYRIRNLLQETKKPKN